MRIHHTGDLLGTLNRYPGAQHCKGLNHFPQWRITVLLLSTIFFFLQKR